ncbi:ATP-binding protein [Actinoplanes palleronii]|uniref:Histidine kinase/HSP90-like ATPase domain-containing protein n=1 Tax=Actinoplanes palleronii TaxID=113570 RepID=A0ABQ4BBS4_9ACTN|nr:ATP-binding protein [Actinoplanes palleronii]GIE68152.1 hypothetical protein Apa02nite_042600 [Actinoplanes palleronii]
MRRVDGANLDEQTDGDPGDQRDDALLLIVDFGMADMRDLRSAVRDRSRGWGLTGEELAQFVLAVHEGCANAVQHGGGQGRLALWRQGHRLRCRITDKGAGLPPDWQLDGHRGQPEVLPSRGLWLINRVCEQVELNSDHTGTCLLLSFRLPAPSGG